MHLKLQARTDLRYNEASRQNPIVTENGFYGRRRGDLDAGPTSEDLLARRAGIPTCKVCDRSRLHSNPQERKPGRVGQGLHSGGELRALAQAGAAQVVHQRRDVQAEHSDR